MFTEDDIRTLAAKLEGLELTDGERQALDTAFAVAADDEVSGFSTPRYDLGLGNMLRAEKPIVGGTSRPGSPPLVGDDIGLLGDEIGL